MYHIGICDDGENICRSLEKMIWQYTEKNQISAEIFMWNAGEALKNFLEQGNRIEILFLDIELLEMSGLEAAEYIRNQLDNMEMQIIYISGKSSYAMQLFHTQPMEFLVKPIEPDRMDAVLDRAFKILGRGEKCFTFHSGKDHFSIPIRKILYLESRGRKILVRTEEEAYTFYGSLKEMEKQLPDHFWKIHHSYLLNRDWVLRYTYETVELKNHEILPISQQNRGMIREKILKEGRDA